MVNILIHYNHYSVEKHHPNRHRILSESLRKKVAWGKFLGAELVVFRQLGPKGNLGVKYRRIHPISLDYFGSMVYPFPKGPFSGSSRSFSSFLLSLAPSFSQISMVFFFAQRIFSSGRVEVVPKTTTFTS